MVFDHRVFIEAAAFIEQLLPLVYIFSDSLCLFMLFKWIFLTVLDTLKISDIAISISTVPDKFLASLTLELIAFRRVWHSLSE